MNYTYLALAIGLGSFLGSLLSTAFNFSVTWYLYRRGSSDREAEQAQREAALKFYLEQIAARDAGEAPETVN